MSLIWTGEEKKSEWVWTPDTWQEALDAWLWEHRFLHAFFTYSIFAGIGFVLAWCLFG